MEVRSRKPVTRRIVRDRPPERTPPETTRGVVRCGLCRREGRWQHDLPMIGTACDACVEHVRAQARRTI